MQLLWISIGGALGSMFRYFLQMRVQAAQAGMFPMGTLAVNLIGSALIGLLAGWFLSATVSHNLRVFLIVGILGGFTTFSTFSLDVLNLVRDGYARTALLYIVASNALGIGLAFGGFFLARALSRSVAGP